MKERSLVLFTLLMQTAAGAYLVPIGLQDWFGNSLSGLDLYPAFQGGFLAGDGTIHSGVASSFSSFGFSTQCLVCVVQPAFILAQQRDFLRLAIYQRCKPVQYTGR